MSGESNHIQNVTRRHRQSATAVNSSLVEDPTIRLPSFDLHRCQWSLLNRFRTGQGHCNACHKKSGFTDNELCDCGETQTMSHIVNSTVRRRTTAPTWSRWGGRQQADNMWLLAYNNNNICMLVTGTVTGKRQGSVGPAGQARVTTTPGGWPTTRCAHVENYRWCPTLLMSARRQSFLVVYGPYTVLMMMLLSGWMVAACNLQDGGVCVEVPTRWSSKISGWHLHSRRVYIRSSTAAFRVVRSSCGPAYSDLYRPPQLRCQWTAYMEQLTRSLTFTGPLVVLFQAPAEVLPVPSLRVSGLRTTVRRHCDCTANLAPYINRQTYLVPTCIR